MIVAVLVVSCIIAGVAAGFWGLSRADKDQGYGLQAFLVVVAVLCALLIGTGARQIPATHVGVVENTVSGELFSIDPGLHIWPFSPYVVPFMTRVTAYDLKRQIIEIGADPVRQSGVQADSNSPGRPVVFFQCRGWAYPSKENIVELHRRYGKDYLEDWVERVWVSELKAIQGSNAYDHVGNNRIAMQAEVELSLQAQLLIDDVALVVVSQLAIVDFDYDENVNSYLDEVAQQEFTRQGAEQQIEINKKLQDAAKIEADTDYLVKVRDAEGLAAAIRLDADADAYAVLVKYGAEAEGIRKVQGAITSEEYLEYVAIKEWDGSYPVYMMGGSVPLVQLPLGE